MPSRTTMAQLLHVAIVVALAGVDATAAVHTRADAHTGAHDEVFPPAAAPAGPAITMPSQMDYWRRNANDKHAIAKPFYALHERGNSTILDAPTCAGNGASCNPATGRGTPCCAGLTCLPFSASCGTGSAMALNAVVVEQHDGDAIALKIEVDGLPGNLPKQIPPPTLPVDFSANVAYTKNGKLVIKQTIAMDSTLNRYYMHAQSTAAGQEMNALTEITRSDGGRHYLVTIRGDSPHIRKCTNQTEYFTRGNFWELPPTVYTGKCAKFGVDAHCWLFETAGNTINQFAATLSPPAPIALVNLNNTYTSTYHAFTAGHPPLSAFAPPKDAHCGLATMSPMESDAAVQTSRFANILDSPI